MILLGGSVLQKKKQKARLAQVRQLSHEDRNAGLVIYGHDEMATQTSP